MSIKVRVHPRFAARVGQARLRWIAQKTLRAEKSRAALTIYITTNAEIRKLNRQFHATNAVTDVLAFPMQSDDALLRAVPNYKHYLGDVVISYERARVQAQKAGWRIADELELLTVHGILHLLRYDDQTPRKRAQMWKRQAEILGRVIRET